MGQEDEFDWDGSELESESESDNERWVLSGVAWLPVGSTSMMAFVVVGI